MRQLIFFALTTCCCGADWQGYEGGGPRHNASSAAIAGTELLWSRSFPAYFHPDISRREGSGYGSRNLVTHGDFIAVIGLGAEEEIPNEKRTYHPELTILERQTGKTRGIFATRQRPGCNSVSRGSLPTGYFGNAVDVPGAFQVLAWDQPTGRIILRAGGDAPAMSSLSPLPQLENWTPATISDVPGSFESDESAEGARGTTRGAAVSPLPSRPLNSWPKLDPEAARGLGEDFFDFRGSNKASFFSVDPHGPLVVAPSSGNHEQGSGVHIWSKENGLQIAAAATRELPVVFHFRDTLIADDGVLYGIGPAQDADGSGTLGNVTGIGENKPDHGKNGRFVFSRKDPGGPDQGMKLWARRAIFYEAGLITGFEELFTVDFPSSHLPRRGPHDAYSYLETDGFQRDKAMLVHDGRLWVAWKPSLEGNVQLCWADASGSGSIDTGIGAGLRGQDIWPRMSLTTIKGRKHIVYAFANGYHREYLDQEYPWSARRGSWSEERTPPDLPSGLALIEIETPRVVWTQNLTEAHPTLPINDYWLHADRMQMVVAGEVAWIGWVDLSGEKATLALAAYDLAATAPQFEMRSIALPFHSEEAKQSFCTDLIAVDGTLYALVTESDTLWPGAPSSEHFNHQAQHVLAIGNTTGDALIHPKHQKILAGSSESRP